MRKRIEFKPRDADVTDPAFSGSASITKTLSSYHLKGWCEEWEIAESDRRLLLERYAEGEDEWELLGFAADLAKERQIRLAQSRKSMSLEDFINDPKNWK